MQDNPANGKGVALFGLLHIPYLKYFLIHPTGILQGLFLRWKPCKSRIFVNKTRILLTLFKKQNSNFNALKNSIEIYPETYLILGKAYYRDKTK